jgi:YD repeat-containing protein
VRNADETYTATDKAQTEWRFDLTGKLTQIRDRHGNASNLIYDGSGRLSTVSDPAGRGVLTLGYTNNLLTSVTDWASPARSVGYQYDASGRLWKVTDREGKTTTFGYDGTSHRLTTITDARGNVALTTTYDAQGRVATQKDARGLLTGDVTTFDYVVNPDGTRETTLTLPTTSFEPSFQPTLTDSYDTNGWLTERETAPSSTETLTQSFTYDAAGNRTSVTDPRGNTTDFCYDVAYDGSTIAGAAANLTRVIAPEPEPGADRPTSLIQYDAKNNVIETVSPKGVPARQTVTCTTDLSAISTSFAAGYEYDAAGINLLSTTTRFTDPDIGLQTAVTKYEYSDPLNPGLATRVIPPRGNTGPSPDYTYSSTLTYFTTGTKAGQLQDVTDALGNKTSYDYDPVSHLISVLDPVGNAAGGVPSEHTTTYAYDKEDRLRFATQPAPTAGGSPLISETRYDEAGKPTVRIDANGQVTTYAYDERNSLFQVQESPNVWTDPASPPAGVITTEYTYDSGGNVTRVTRAKGDGTYERATDYAYDGRGLVRQETQYPAWPSTSGPLVASTAFDASGNPLSSVDPLGQTTTFAHDALNRLIGIDYSDAGTPDVAYAYDAHGNRTSMTAWLRPSGRPPDASTCARLSRMSRLICRLSGVAYVLKLRHPWGHQQSRAGDGLGSGGSRPHPWTARRPRHVRGPLPRRDRLGALSGSPS